MVSVIIYSYNAEDRLRQCVESVLMQTYESFEIIIIDDGSSDLSAVKALQLADEDYRIQVYCHAKRTGPAKQKIMEYITHLEITYYFLTVMTAWNQMH